MKKEINTTALLYCIDELLHQSNRKQINVAIDGNSGAGKSTFASDLALKYDCDGCNIFHMDDFFDDNYGRFYNEVILQIKTEKPFIYRAYSCKTDDYREVEIEPKRLNIIEGVYSMSPKYGNIYDLKIFLSIKKHEQQHRLMVRNPALYKRFVYEWLPAENMYFEQFNIKDKCDFVLELSQNP